MRETVEIKIERETEFLIVNVVPTFRDLEDDLDECRCPHCGLMVRYPMIARESDIKALDQLIEATKGYMRDHGIDTGIVREILERCLNRIRENKSKVVV
jgi:hypothetical protein